MHIGTDTHRHTHTSWTKVFPVREQMRCDIKSAMFSYKWNNSSQVAGWYWVLLMPEATSNCAITAQHWKRAAHSVWKLPRVMSTQLLTQTWISCVSLTVRQFPHTLHKCASLFKYCVHICIYACTPWICRPSVAFWNSDKPRVLNIYFWGNLFKSLDSEFTACICVHVCAGVIAGLIKNDFMGWQG